MERPTPTWSVPPLHGASHPYMERPTPTWSVPPSTHRFHRVGGVGAECLHSAFKLQKKKLSREWAADSSDGRAEDCSRFRNCP